MARISVEDCLKNVENRFALVKLASFRAKELFQGSSPLVSCKNKEIVTALREVAAGKIHFTENVADILRNFSVG